MKNLSLMEPCFVLSTGRTGTTFLTEFLRRHYSDIACLQEPGVGWLTNVCSNLRAEKRLPAASLPVLRRQFFRARNTLVRSKEVEKYIEINPFLYGMGDLLNAWLKEPRILHMIRSPWTCIPSLMRFKPRGWRRFFVHAPFWNLNVEKAKARGKGSLHWSSLSWMEKKAWQWVYINEMIGSYRRLNGKYHVARYEDLFSSDRGLRYKTLLGIVDFFGLKEPAAFDESMFQIRVNPRAAEDETEDGFWDENAKEKMLAICRDAMERFGYT